MLLPTDETADAGEDIISPTDGPVASTSAQASVMHPHNQTMLELHQCLATLRLRVDTLQDQVLTQQAQIVTLTTSNPVKDPVCQVNELKQKGIIPNYTESCTSTGLPHDPIHTCSWTTHDASGEVFTASSTTIKQAKKNCAILYLAAFEHME